MIAAEAVTACMANYLPDPFDLLNANIEALAQDESLDPGEGRDFIYCIYNPNYGGPGIFVCSGNNECRFEYNLTWPTKSQTGICTNKKQQNFYIRFGRFTIEFLSVR